MHFVAEKVHASFEAHGRYLNKDTCRPIQPATCRPTILVSGNIRRMGIFAGVRLFLAWASNESGVVNSQRRQFLEIQVATSSESSEIRPAVLYDDMLTLVGR